MPHFDLIRAKNRRLALKKRASRRHNRAQRTHTGINVGLDYFCERSNEDSIYSVLQRLVCNAVQSGRFFVTRLQLGVAICILILASIQL